MKEKILLGIAFLALIISIGALVMQEIDTKAYYARVNSNPTVVTENSDVQPQGDFIFNKPYKVLHRQGVGFVDENGKLTEQTTRIIRKWTIIGPVYGRITSVYENGVLTSETHMKMPRWEAKMRAL